MTWLLVAGGAPGLVVVVFGLVALAAAVRFAIEPRLARLGYIGALVLAVASSAVVGVLADLTTVAIQVPEHPEWIEEQGFIVVLLTGFAESMTPGIVGFSLISLTALVCAVGLRRLPARA